MDAIEQLLRDRPRFHGGGTLRWDSLPETLAAIRDSVRPGHRTLETGCGASTVVFAAAGAHHTAVSPNADEHVRIREYVRSIGIDDSKLDFVVGFSDEVLPGMAGKDTLDVAFIDGAHSFPYPAVDWHYIASSIRIGGRLLLDDIPVPAVAYVFKFMQQEPNWRLDQILDDRAAIFTLTSDAPPEDWVLQKSNRRPDYSFAPLPHRVKLQTEYEVSQARKWAAKRFPAARDAWKRVSGGGER